MPASKLEPTPRVCGVARARTPFGHNSNSYECTTAAATTTTATTTTTTTTNLNKNSSNKNRKKNSVNVMNNKKDMITIMLTIVTTASIRWE